MVLTAAAVSLFASSALADGTVTLPGGPLVVSVGTLGECQSSYPNVGVNFFPPSGTLGDCGFFLAFPAAAANPTALKNGTLGTVFGFAGSAGPGLGDSGSLIYTAIGQGPSTGTGTVADPYTEVTTYKASASNLDYALVTDTTTYVSGQAQFTAKYDVQNVTGSGSSAAPSATLYFHALVAGDLFVANEDAGTGVFLGGPPRFIGGQNPHTGTLGGLIEAPAPALPWSNYQEGNWNGDIWNAVRASAAATPVFDNSINPILMDNGVGVSWDQFLTTGLAASAHATFSVVNRTQVPSTLSVQPVNQNLTVGATATVKVTATDNVGTPYANRPLVYKVAGANPRSGTITTDAAGVGTITYPGTAAGLDTIQMFLDLAGTGTQTTQDPSSAAQITWAPAPPTPNSSYTVQSIAANPDGTITITFVPTQSGAATVVTTVPTGTIASLAAFESKAKKCKKGKVKIHGKCLPKTTSFGKVLTAPGTAGVPLKLSVKPSKKTAAILKKGRTLHVTATLTYKSSLGGASTAHVYKVTVKGKKAKKKHKKH
ncbi:MAG TPA: Ig-like domain-containing protein [Solirubrobacteraceae bacterium]|nr:Ig-like domain-containing protein [Solirubrobacteraceae bacterium]